MRYFCRALWALLLVANAQPAAAQTPTGAVPPSDAAWFPQTAARIEALEAQGWMLHGQATFIPQGHPDFRSPYANGSSLQPGLRARNTFSSDLILGRRLWSGAEFVVDASVTRGFGISNSVGVAAYPNNEAFRLGSTDPTFFVPRAFFRQTIGLSADAADGDDGDQLRFRGPLPRERVTITAGKFGVWDIFDDNRYAHDPRTQFLNWALVGAGAYDYVADSRGWTNGIALEWEDGTWGVRTGVFQQPRRVNGLFLDPGVLRAWQALAQLDHFHEVGGRPGAVRLIGGVSRARLNQWGELFRNGFDNFEINPSGYRTKLQAAINLEQELTDDLGVFARISWNDGRTQNWSFTEQDRAISGGLSLRGLRWDRPDDTVGLGSNVGWISAGRRQYLEAGGIGFIVGDGRLNYAPEWITELYYDARVAPGTNLAVNWQLVVNPGYNQDRGPVNIFALRARVAF